jgi:dienelactone hydrolase
MANHSSDGREMWAYLSLSDSLGPNPAIVVAQHGAGVGVDDWIQDITRRLSAAGYAAIAPLLFHREDPSAVNDPPSSRVARLRDENIIKDVNATIELL